jgi:hypothetical protein
MCFAAVKGHNREAVHSPPSSAEVKYAAAIPNRGASQNLSGVTGNIHERPSVKPGVVSTEISRNHFYTKEFCLLGYNSSLLPASRDFLG